MTTGRGWWVLLVLAALAACADERSVELDVGGDSTFAKGEVSYAPDDEFATLTENGAVKLGLTRERVYFEVSDALRQTVDREIREGMGESDSRIARSIGGAVRRGVQRALEFDVHFDIDEIEDVDYRDGELVFDWVDPDRDPLRNMELDGEPLTRAFDEDDARAFVDAFRRLKVLSKGAQVDTAAAADTAGRF